MATLARQAATLAGVAVTYGSAAGGGDKFLNHGSERLHVKNGSGAPITVTIAGQVECDRGSTHNIAVSVPAGGDRYIGPFSSRFTDEDGYLQITYSGVTSLTVAVLA